MKAMKRGESPRSISIRIYCFFFICISIALLNEILCSFLFSLFFYVKLFKKRLRAKILVIQRR